MVTVGISARVKQLVVKTDEMLTKECKLPSLISCSEQRKNDTSSAFGRCVKTFYDSNTIDWENKQLVLQERWTHKRCSDVPDCGTPKINQNMGNQSKIHPRKEVIELFINHALNLMVQKIHN